MLTSSSTKHFQLLLSHHANWVWVKILNYQKTAGFRPCFHLPPLLPMFDQPIWFPLELSVSRKAGRHTITAMTSKVGTWPRPVLLGAGGGLWSKGPPDWISGFRKKERKKKQRDAATCCVYSQMCLHKGKRTGRIKIVSVVVVIIARILLPKHCTGSRCNTPWKRTPLDCYFRDHGSSQAV